MLIQFYILLDCFFEIHEKSQDETIFCMLSARKPGLRTKQDWIQGQKLTRFNYFTS